MYTLQTMTAGIPALPIIILLRRFLRFMTLGIRGHFSKNHICEFFIERHFIPEWSTGNHQDNPLLDNDN